MGILQTTDGHQMRVIQSEDEKSSCHDSNATTEKKDRSAAIGHNLLLNHKVTSIAKPEVGIVM